MSANEGFEESLGLVFASMVGVAVVTGVCDEIEVAKNSNHGIGQILDFWVDFVKEEFEGGSWLSVAIWGVSIKAAYD